MLLKTLFWSIFENVICKISICVKITILWVFHGLTFSEGNKHVPDFSNDNSKIESENTR